MPVDIFIGKSNVQTSIYVFKVGEKHNAKQIVKFIDFRNDGYKRSNRKKAKASSNLQDVNNASDRYQEVSDLVNFGSTYLNLLTKNEYIESTIATSGKDFGNDWNFDRHIIVDSKPTLEDFQKTITDYLSWEIQQVIKSDEKLGK